MGIINILENTRSTKSFRIQSMKRIGILQPSYLPWLGYFEQIYQSDLFVFYDDAQYEKGSWRNRNRIKTPHGIQWLTIPVLTKGKGFVPINEIEIKQNGWQDKHIKSIRQNYVKSPFFDKYSESLFSIISHNWHLLADINIEIIKWICEVLGLHTNFMRSSDLHANVGRGNNRLINIIKELDCDVFYEGCAGKNYIDKSQFAAEGISVVYQNYKHPVYDQLYGEFLPYLSIIDLLYNHGPASLSILTEKGK